MEKKPKGANPAAPHGERIGRNLLPLQETMIYEMKTLQI